MQRDDEGLTDMTPLAQKLQGELILKPHKRRIETYAEGLLEAAWPDSLGDFKFFDTRPVFARVPFHEESFDSDEAFPPWMLREIDRLNAGESELAFMPAKFCWMEINDTLAVVLTTVNTGLSADEISEMLIKEKGRDRRTGESMEPIYPGENKDVIALFAVGLRASSVISIQAVATMIFPESRRAIVGIGFDEFHKRVARLRGESDATKMVDSLLMYAHVALIAINSSRYTVSNHIMPGERDRRRSLRGKSLVGKFPLRAYSEIVLQPGETIIPEPQTCATTGERAQHFVRSHLRRYRSGKTVLVKEHHRGNPALGMIQHRYRIEKP